jgi:hypothetical protein
MVQARDPAGFAHLIVAGPFRFTMHRGQHAVLRTVLAVIVGQVIALERIVVAHEKMRLWLTLQPGIVVGLQIPQMVMRVNQGDAALRYPGFKGWHRSC